MVHYSYEGMSARLKFIDSGIRKLRQTQRYLYVHTHFLSLYSMVFKEKYVILCFLIPTLMLLNLEDENQCLKN